MTQSIVRLSLLVADGLAIRLGPGLAGFAPFTRRHRLPDPWLRLAGKFGIGAETCPSEPAARRSWCSPCFAAFLVGTWLVGVPFGMAGAVPGPQTFCNPLNLDYGWSARGHRHSADPVIVLFKDRYYLFATDDVPGYRVSDDLLSWTKRRVRAGVAPADV